MLTLEEIKYDYNKIKQLAWYCVKYGDIEKALKLIVVASRIAYEYNFQEKFCDEELESIVANITQDIIPEASIINSYQNRIVFYDYFAIQNRGLTEQYISSLIELKYEILFVVENDRSYNTENEIFINLAKNPLCRLLVISDNLSYVEKAKKILSAIEAFKPSKAFLHIAPWDVTALLVFKKLESQIHRYFINLTDHAFWLGKNIIDTCIEFRNFGYQLSKVCREIKENNLDILPYYPILQQDDKFQGMPDIQDGMVIGVSGGNGYKFLGDNSRFYKWVSHLLNKHKNFCFILVGAKNAKPFFQPKIKQDFLEDRFIFLEDRSDIFQFLKRCDLYIGSYPFLGGLMSQLAVKANLPIICYTQPDWKFNYLEDLFIKDNPQIKTFLDEEEFLQTISNLINDSNLRNQNRPQNLNTPSCIISKDEFTLVLGKIIDKKTNDYKNKLIKNLDIKNTSTQIFQLFLEIENYYFPKYKNILSSLYSLEVIKIDRVFHNKIKIRINSSNSLFAPMLLFKREIKKLYRGIKKLSILLSKKEVIKFKTGQNVDILREPNTIINPKYISIGNGFRSLYGLRMEAIDNYSGQKFLPDITIGDNVHVGSDCHFGCINKLSIGHNVLIASKVYISDHSHGEILAEELKIPPNSRLLFSKGPVIIENNVWIGEGVCVLPNVRIGENSIVGANAVVTKDVPKNCVVAGVPAKVIKVLK